MSEVRMILEPAMSKISYRVIASTAVNIQASAVRRSAYITSREYCDNKSIYERLEEGKKPRVVHGQEYPEWRKPWIERDGEWKTKLSVFSDKNPSTEILNALQKLPNLDLQALKDWWTEMKQVQEIQNQKFLPERVAALGSNLAAMHFFIYRHCAIRLKNSKIWMTGFVPQLRLPDKYEDGYFVEAVDCSKFHHNGIRYEGIQNLAGLNFLKWLSLKNNKHIDVWCLDRLAGQNGRTLEYLDITGMQLTTEAVFALGRMPALKFLVITDPGDNIDVQAALSILESENPKLTIKAEFPEGYETITPKLPNVTQFSVAIETKK